jgi:CRP-like cAMP-binding protein
MYFIGRGDCRVDIVGQDGRKATRHPSATNPNLGEGDHFGEIQMIYENHRSASVISLNYNTLAKLTYSDYKNLVGEFPEYEFALKNYITSNYKDSKIQFLRKMIRSVSYLQDVDNEPELMTRLIFSLRC